MKKTKEASKQNIVLLSYKLATLCKEVAVHLQLLLMQVIVQNLTPFHQTVANISNIQAHLQLYSAISSLPVCVLHT